jgi:hypothetical protein
MNRIASILLAAAVGVGGLMSGSCSSDPHQGYTWGPPFRKDIRTVAVPIWTVGKDVYRRGLEFRLTEAIKKQIPLRTPYQISDKSRADTLLTGTIDSVIQRPLSINPDTGRPRESEITLVVTFTWTDLRSGKGGETLKQEVNFRASDTYIPSAPFNEDFFWGSESLMNRLAQQIVEKMELPWGKATTEPAGK